MKRTIKPFLVLAILVLVVSGSAQNPAENDTYNYAGRSSRRWSAVGAIPGICGRLEISACGGKSRSSPTVPLI